MTLHLLIAQFDGRVGQVVDVGIAVVGGQHGSRHAGGDVPSIAVRTGG